MNILDELAALCRQFPNSPELAVSAEMVFRYESETVNYLRYVPVPYSPWVFEYEEYPAFSALRLPLKYRDRRLTQVIPR